MPEPIKEQVKQALDGGAAPAPAPEKVAPQGVNTEAPKEPIDAAKYKEQVDNLNTALKEEREARRLETEARKKIEDEFGKAKPIIERFQNFIAPEPAPVIDKPEPLTKEQLETFWTEKQEELKQQSFKEKQAEIIKSEISTLQKEWNGVDGKPKYIDEEVLKWQQENSKLYLTPVEAFNQMKKNEIIDWEVKQRLAGKKSVQNVERSGVSPDLHVPAEKLPKTEKELRDAIWEQINSADAEM